MLSLEFFSAVGGLILTLMIFSYLINDNPLFRMAVYLFIGVASGYAATVIWQYVLAPKVVIVLQSTDPNLWLLTVIPLLLGFTLLAKLFPKIAWLGDFAMAILVGVGAATALGGALLGTLIPQIGAAIDAVDFRSATDGAFAKLIEGGVMLLGTVFTLGYFQFTANRAPDGTIKRNVAFEIIAWVGRVFIAITFGVLFAGVYMAALTAMIERLTSIINFLRQLIGF
ncbi:MAG: hypothetical protein IT314_02010 [Anaerolineales bacterium]|nr:hypothetical protein [Anaerolineales bacterium]